MFITHSFLLHTQTPNYLHYARVIANPHVNLREPYNLNRADGDYVSRSLPHHSPTPSTESFVQNGRPLTSRPCASRSSSTRSTNPPASPSTPPALGQSTIPTRPG